MGQGDYSLTEFAHRLAQSEAKYGKELLEIIECFTNSRVDLPVKKLEDLSRARMKCARHLLKIDFKKEECINLWKLCNIYSTTAVDVDNAMRDIRSALRKRIKTKDTYRDVSTFRRLIDEYRPTKKTVVHQEIYDKPTSKEKQRWLELNMFGKKKEEKKNMDSYVTVAKKSKVAPKLEKNEKENISKPLMGVQTYPNLATDRIVYESQTNSRCDSPGMLSSFQPSTPSLPQFPPSINASNKLLITTLRNDYESQINPVDDSPTKFRSLQVNTPPVPHSPSLNHATNELNMTTSRIEYGSQMNPTVDSPTIFQSFQPSTPPISHSPSSIDATNNKSTIRNDEVSIASSLTDSQEGETMSSPLPKTVPVQVLPSHSDQPVAPPRLNALKAKTAIVASNHNGDTHSVSNVGESEKSRPNANTTSSHTLIEILPSSPVLAKTMDNGAENSNSIRQGVFAKQHSIKIDSSPFRHNAEIPRTDTDYLAISGGEFAVIVNRL
ncbi:hypothetical protein KIN20_006979 [Parelaphostrongylus tenuis]|uniref:Uncharacterized protein n=1 Tax=Parelaphostrongylus tenuis TaxID=148309 RepID=A0AAD5QLI7_PARTN|nr:hypothetical protein KIN20_006979 [Parelaphostrongylus tenuis]